MAEYYVQPTADGDAVAAMTEWVKAALEKGVFDAVLVATDVPQGPAAMYTLIGDPSKVGRVNPFAPVMPANAGTLVGRLTADGGPKKLAAFLRPCEVRALVELAKLRQATLDNLTIIGMDCFGTLTVAALTSAAKSNGGFAKTSAELSAALRSGGGLPGGAEIRKACRMCIHPEAENADIKLCLYGDTPDGLVFEAVTEKGKAALEGIELSTGAEPAGRKEKLGTAREARGKVREETLPALREKVNSLSGMVEIFSACIRCHNCRTVCPLCYCLVCTFSTPTFEHKPEQYYGWLEKKGAMRLPEDISLFHLTRASHMAHSCIGCGMCTQACPSDIPVGGVFQVLQERVDEIFDYVPGRSVDEPLPFQAYEEEELDPR